MGEDRPRDGTWAAAWGWVQRQHEVPMLPPAEHAALQAWLAADAGHRAAYDRASRLWLMTGLVPPVNDLPEPRDPPDQA